LIGRKGESSKPFNIINQNYEQNEVGDMFRMREQENEMRRDARSRRMMMIGDSAFNIINGNDRANIVGTIKPYLGVGDATGAGRPVRSVAARIDVGDINIGKRVHREYYPTTVQPIEDDSRISSPKSGKKIFNPAIAQIQVQPNPNENYAPRKESSLSSAGNAVITNSQQSLYDRPKPEYQAFVINKHNESPRSLFAHPPIQIGEQLQPKPAFPQQKWRMANENSFQLGGAGTKFY
jgi:hypothetical protein